MSNVVADGSHASVVVHLPAPGAGEQYLGIKSSSLPNDFHWLPTRCSHSSTQFVSVAASSACCIPWCWRSTIWSGVPFVSVWLNACVFFSGIFRGSECHFCLGRVWNYGSLPFIWILVSGLHLSYPYVSCFAVYLCYMCFKRNLSPYCLPWWLKIRNTLPENSHRSIYRLKSSHPWSRRRRNDC